MFSLNKRGPHRASVEGRRSITIRDGVAIVAKYDKIKSNELKKNRDTRKHGTIRPAKTQEKPKALL